MPQQIPLAVYLDDEATFANFYCSPGSANAQVLQVLQSQFEPGAEPFVYIWGARGTGATHLLQASCHAADALGLSLQYLPLNELKDCEPGDLLDGLEAIEFICLDGLQAVVGNKAWEEALFAFYNALRDRGGKLLLAADASPNNLNLNLADLRSRLNAGLTLGLKAMDDQEKLAALQWRAKERGLELSDEVGQFILTRAPRDMGEIFQSLNRLDKASLAEQRRLTIPFVKQTLSL